MFVSALDEIADHVKAAARQFEAVDRHALDILDAVQANPATAEGLDILAQLTHLPPEALAAPIGMLRITLQAVSALAPAQAAQPQAGPAGPVVGGQA